MQTIKELYKFGPGPSSSHTLAPYRACSLFREEYPNVKSVRVELYGSLSFTGRGHYTDTIIKEVFNDIPCEVVFNDKWNEEFPSGFYIFGDNIKWTVFSLGGGSIQILEHPIEIKESYKENSFKSIKELCINNKWSLVDYVFKNEDDDLYNYLEFMLDGMLDSVDRGLKTVGVLPGGLGVNRCAKQLLEKADNDRLRMIAYAYAAGEENASRGKIVTSPTAGSCGVLASLMYHCYNDLKIPREMLVNALAVASIFGNLIKTNATISGAIGGCQAEIGVACSMAAAAYAYLDGLNDEMIEYAAEIAMEHHLGLTCDPVNGQVIIPCIERNAVAVLRAVDASELSKLKYNIAKNRVTFDNIVKTMNDIGHMIPFELKETSLGGLAKELKGSC